MKTKKHQLFEGPVVDSDYAVLKSDHSLAAPLIILSFKTHAVIDKQRLERCFTLQNAKRLRNFLNKAIAEMEATNFKPKKAQAKRKAGRV